jgi:hypothetical protein
MLAELTGGQYHVLHISTAEAIEEVPIMFDLVWEMMWRNDDPSDVSHTYRTYRDSPHCTVPKQNLRAMRDTMITAMREANRQDSNPRKEKKAGVHYQKNVDVTPQRNSA